MELGHIPEEKNTGEEKEQWGRPGSNQPLPKLECAWMCIILQTPMAYERKMPKWVHQGGITVRNCAFSEKWHRARVIWYKIFKLWSHVLQKWKKKSSKLEVWAHLIMRLKDQLSIPFRGQQKVTMARPGGSPSGLRAPQKPPTMEFWGSVSFNTNNQYHHGGRPPMDCGQHSEVWAGSVTWPPTQTRDVCRP